MHVTVREKTAGFFVELSVCLCPEPVLAHHRFSNEHSRTAVFSGEQSVQVRRSSAIATDAEFGGQHARNLTVAEFVRRYMDKENNKGSGEKCGASASEEGKEGAGSCKDSMDGDGEDDGSSVVKDDQEEEEDPEYGSRNPATRLCYAQPCCIAIYYASSAWRRPDGTLTRNSPLPSPPLLRCYLYCLTKLYAGACVCWQVHVRARPAEGPA